MKDFMPTEDEYKVLFVVNAIDELRDKGFVTGGIKSKNRDKTQETLAYGKRLGYSEPTNEEVMTILYGLEAK